MSLESALAPDAVPALNVTDPSFSITSTEVHDARERSWYATTPYGFAVLRYDEVGHLLKHRNLRQGSGAWPALNGVTEGPFARWWASWILHKEGADHNRLRRLMNPAFSSKVIAPLAPRFQNLAAELVEGFQHGESCEFLSEFAEPYAARVLAIMLGLPEDEYPVIVRESNTLALALGVSMRNDMPKIESALSNLYAYADAVIADRRAQPRADFVSALTNATLPEDGRLSDIELRDAMVMLILGGYDTTHRQLGLAMQTFSRHLDQWDLLRERPELGSRAVEEVMRVNPTVRWVTREVLEDFTFQGLDLLAGTTIHLYTEAAGTDPRSFDNSFDITVERQPHFGFGGGAHHCLGHFVARSDMSEALTLLARRLRGIRILPGQSWLPDSGNTGPVRLPIGFTLSD
ncbi:cytochrome P450 [Catenulispora rubra]|uniref:cytochrome P450 n=1 Tax=Catenulispora rubra TaxID=280293 RepID=UPI0018920DDB|nr:cytochrome P450 [Catenulispora rubra]